jgi:hypothetical protein
MAKILRGRIVVARKRFGGFAGMDSKTAEELHAWADRLDRRSSYSNPADDPRWLRRHANLLRRLAEQKERSCEHKAASRKTDMTDFADSKGPNAKTTLGRMVPTTTEPREDRAGCSGLGRTGGSASSAGPPFKTCTTSPL